MRRFAVGILVSILAAPAGAGEPVSLEESEALRNVATKVEQLRELTFTREVPFANADRSALREYATRRLDQFSSPDSLRAEEQTYQILGLIPPGTSLTAAYGGLVEEAAGGYYDPDSGAYFIVEGLPPGTGPILAAHELTHALEDQHFDLDARIESAGQDADRAFAIMAVHEGSASLLMAVYVAEGLRQGWLKREDLDALVRVETARGAGLAASPTFLRRALLGAYVLGTWFLTRGGSGVPGLSGYPAPDVDEVYRDGPRSSEQILHPEKYWDRAHRDDPREVRLPDAAGLLGPGWKRSGEGVLGELLLGPLVGAPTPPTWEAGSIRGGDWSNAAAAGWGGDRWEIWSAGSRSVVLLVTAWDSSRDAREFAAALPAREQLVAQRSGDRVAVVAGPIEDESARRLARRLARLTSVSPARSVSRSDRTSEPRPGS